MGKDEPKWEKNADEGHVEKETNVRDGHFFIINES